MSFDKNLSAAARTLRKSIRQTAVPGALRARVLADLPEIPAVRKRANRSMVSKLAIALVALVLLGATLVNRPHFLQPVLAAEVTAAIHETNTWHLSGWRLQEGKKLRWKIWGRRQPFFYREQVGDETLIDNGHVRTHIFPAKPRDRWRYARPGFILIQASAGKKVASLDDARAGFLVGLGGDLIPQNNTGEASTAGTTTFEGQTEMGGATDIKEKARLIVDSRTHLPIRYGVECVESKPKVTPDKHLDGDHLTPLRRYPFAELTAAYNVPLPPNSERFSAPSDYPVIDLTRRCTDPAAQGPGVTSQNGLTLKAVVMGQDAAGNLRLKFLGWLGNHPFHFHLLPLALLINRLPGEESPDEKLGEDETGRLYFQVMDSGNVGEQPELWLAPAEPYAAHMPRPKQITLTVQVGLSGDERMGNIYRPVPVVNQEMTFEVPLPVTTHDLGYMDPKLWSNYLGHKPKLTFLEQVAEDRGSFYIHQMKQVPEWSDSGQPLPGATQAEIFCFKRSSYWWGVAVTEAERTGDKATAAMYRANIADNTQRIAQLRSTIR